MAYLISGTVIDYPRVQSGGEFGVFSPNNPGFGLPGRFSIDYAFINKVYTNLIGQRLMIRYYRAEHC